MFFFSTIERSFFHLLKGKKNKVSSSQFRKNSRRICIPLDPTSSRSFLQQFLKESVRLNLKTSWVARNAPFRPSSVEKLAEWLGGREGKVETAPSTLEIREGGMEKLSSAIIHRERGRETVSRVPRDRPRAVVCQIKRKTRGNCQRERVLPPEGWRQTRLGGQSAARSMFISSSFQFSRVSMHFQNSICVQRCGIDTGISQN